MTMNWRQQWLPAAWDGVNPPVKRAREYWFREQSRLWLPHGEYRPHIASQDAERC